MATATNSALEERIALFKAIERFIFVEFRLGGFQSNYQSSVYYNKSRDVLSGTVSLDSVTESLNYTVDNDMDSAIRAFIARTKKRLDSGVGYYGWRDLRYFLFEYEYNKGIKNKLHKTKWEMFTHIEKDKVTIEHILPQTPTKWYWQNTFRMYDEDEIWTLSVSLGNLLPLSQSINSSLQNDSFPDKKKPSGGRRGYVNGSHSEIEVAQETDWTAENILNRGLLLLDFMEERWGITFDNKQKIELLHIDFVNERRSAIPEIPQPTTESPRLMPSTTIYKSDDDSIDSGGTEYIGRDMVEVAYNIAQQVYECVMGRSEGKEEIALRTGMNPGSAGDYISAFLAMMDGVEYKRTINEHSTKYFVNRIRADYGDEAFRKAIEACDKHAKYYAALGRGRLAYVERIVEEFK
jgi:hypothetical protein